MTISTQTVLFFDDSFVALFRLVDPFVVELRNLIHSLPEMSFLQVDRLIVRKS